MTNTRQSDRFSRKAQAEGFAARSIYKLEEIDRKHHVVPRGGRVLDLGCAPGSWSQYVASRGGPGTRLVGIDLQEVRVYPGDFVQGSILEVPLASLIERLGGPADLVLSDMAPSTTGTRRLDHYRQIELAQMALEVARRALRPGGAFVVKVFEGEDAQAYFDEVRRSFTEVRRMKPEAVRRESVEFFVVARGFRGAPAAGSGDV